jgi:hypothetical protein
LSIKILITYDRQRLKEAKMIDFCAVGRKIVNIFKPVKINDPITFFDVKELYNLAYEQKAQARNALRRYRRIALEAQALDNAYRARLGLATQRAA